MMFPIFHCIHPICDVLLCAILLFCVCHLFLVSFGMARNNHLCHDLEPPTDLRVCVGNGLAGANPAVNTPRPSRGTRIESCDFIVLIGDL